jgi:hypothetical protein
MLRIRHLVQRLWRVRFGLPHTLQLRISRSGRATQGRKERSRLGCSFVQPLILAHALNVRLALHHAVDQNLHGLIVVNVGGKQYAQCAFERAKLCDSERGDCGMVGVHDESSFPTV